MEEIKEAEGVKVGDKVRHKWFNDVATITAKRQAHTMGRVCWVYTLNFGHSVIGPYGTDYNGGEFLREALIISTAKDILS
jgi:hypothetical protein